MHLTLVGGLQNGQNLVLNILSEDGTGRAEKGLLLIRSARLVGVPTMGAFGSSGRKKKEQGLLFSMSCCCRHVNTKSDQRLACFGPLTFGSWVFDF